MPADPTPPNHPARYWHAVRQDEVVCTLCPRECHLRPGQRGLCYVRMNQDGAMVLETYGRASGYSVDPIEKKPLHHFLPGSSVFSFGSVGCNLKCKCCQNWDISTSHDGHRLGKIITPEQIADAALRNNCPSVAITYNEPIISLEYAIDVAKACRARGLKMVAVTAGYITEEAHPEFCAAFDAFNVDLKAFTDTFYKNYCGASLAPVLDTLNYIHHQTDALLEITTLVIPGHNDSDAELTQLSTWIAKTLSPDIPLHLSAFHPDHKMRDVPRTSVPALIHARDIAMQTGLNYVYTANIHNPNGDTTYCPNCKKSVIARDWHEIKSYSLDPSGRCTHCGHPIPGVYA